MFHFRRCLPPGGIARSAASRSLSGEFGSRAGNGSDGKGRGRGRGQGRERGRERGRGRAAAEAARSGPRPRPRPRPPASVVAERREAQGLRMEGVTRRLLDPAATPVGSLTPSLVRTLTEAAFWHLHRRSYEGTDRADSLLRRLADEGGGGREGRRGGVAPHAVCAVLDSWRILSSSPPSSSSGGGSPGGPGGLPPEERAEGLLRHIEGLLPPPRAYNLAVDGYARAGRPAGAARVALELHPRPGAVAHNGLLKAWARSGRADGPRRAEEHLFSMLRGAAAGGARPDAVSWGTVLGAYARGTGGDGGHGAARAERLLRRMEAEAGAGAGAGAGGEGEPGATNSAPSGASAPRPNVVVYAQVISAWARSGSAEAGSRAEAVLGGMEAASGGVRPNTVCFNAAIDAWSRSPGPDGPAGGERLLREMERRSQEETEEEEEEEEVAGGGGGGIRPNAISYTSVISAHARSGVPGSARRAEDVLARMVLERERTGDPSVGPTAHSYSAVIAAYARSGERGAAERAEGILDLMLRKSGRGGATAGAGAGAGAVRPNAVAFNSVIHALSRSGAADAPVRAEAIVSRMREICERADSPAEVRPTLTTYNSLLNCWAKSARKESAQRALHILEEMEASHGLPSPDVCTYTSVLDALSTAEMPGAAVTAVDLVARLEEAHERTKLPSLRPNILLYTSLLQVIGKTARSTDELDGILRRVEKQGLHLDRIFCNTVDELRKRIYRRGRVPA